MKTRILTALITISAVSFLLFACRKSVTENETDPEVPPGQVAPFPENPLMNCPNAPDYGDTLICPSPSNGHDYVISPINNPGSGKYLSWPMGMSIDSVTGAINVSQSESGMRYMIGFIKQGTTDTCLTQLIISGLSYIDSVFVLSNGEKTSLPYFNADPNLNTSCASGNCEFDMNGQNQKIAVNPTTGVIDLQKTLDQGAFGLLALDGDMIEATIRYQINDGCTNRQQKIKVQLIYFTSKSLIGISLINTILMRQSNIRNRNSGGIPRPPLIIITRYN